MTRDFFLASIHVLPVQLVIIVLEAVLLGNHALLLDRVHQGLISILVMQRITIYALLARWAITAPTVLLYKHLVLLDIFVLILERKACVQHYSIVPKSLQLQCPALNILGAIQVHSQLQIVQRTLDTMVLQALLQPCVFQTGTAQLDPLRPKHVQTTRLAWQGLLSSQIAAQMLDITEHQGILSPCAQKIIIVLRVP